MKSLIQLLSAFVICHSTFAALPNILLILADDLGHGDVRCYNAGSKVPTPNIDQFASEGMRFTNAHCPATFCTPSRYSLMTRQMAFCVPFSARRDLIATIADSLGAKLPDNAGEAASACSPCSRAKTAPSATSDGNTSPTSPSPTAGMEAKRKTPAATTALASTTSTKTPARRRMSSKNKRQMPNVWLTCSLKINPVTSHAASSLLDSAIGLKSLV